MSTEFDHEAIRDFGIYVEGRLGNEYTYAWAVQVGAYGCSAEGFTGLLQPLAPAMDAMRTIAVEGSEVLQQRFRNLGQGLNAAANDYANTERSNAQGFANMEGTVP